MAADTEETLNGNGIQNIIEKYGLHLKAYKPCRRVWRVATDAGYKYLKKSKLSRAEIKFIYE